MLLLLLLLLLLLSLLLLILLLLLLLVVVLVLVLLFLELQRLLLAALLLRRPPCPSLLLLLLLLFLLLLEGAKTSGPGSLSRDEGGRRFLLHRAGIPRRLVAARRVTDGNGIPLYPQPGRLGGSLLPLGLGASVRVGGDGADSGRGGALSRLVGGRENKGRSP